MTYSMESTQLDDSDTFDSFKSCPVCMIPDSFPLTGIYISGQTIERSLISIITLGIIVYGLYNLKTSRN
jgi:hypothetical protein